MPGRWFLHFIGKSYYTIASFKKEAQKYGVSRRISLQVLKKMTWGNKVLLCMLQGKTPVVFGYFVIERIGGLPPEAAQKVQEKYPCEVVDFGGYVVRRNCGEYVAGLTFCTTASVQEIAAEVEAAEEKGQLMVMGTFHPHKPVRLLDIPFRQGFRPFDYEAFQKSIEPRQRGLPVARGQFYVSGGAEVAREAGGEIQVVQDYKRKEEILCPSKA